MFPIQGVRGETIHKQLSSLGSCRQTLNTRHQRDPQHRAGRGGRLAAVHPRQRRWEEHRHTQARRDSLVRVSEAAPRQDDAAQPSTQFDDPEEQYHACISSLDTSPQLTPAQPTPHGAACADASNTDGDAFATAQVDETYGLENTGVSVGASGVLTADVDVDATASATTTASRAQERCRR